MTRVSLHCVMYLAKVATVLPKLHILHFKIERKGMGLSKKKWAALIILNLQEN